LGEGDVAAEREQGDAIIYAVFACPTEETGAESDGETLDLEAAFAGGEEVPEFVDEN
jgi:hypothetical protein